MAVNIEEMVESIANMTVKELNELRKALEEKFDIQATAPVAAVAVAPGAAGAGAGAEEEEKSEVSVYIKSPGDQRLQVIKIVKEITGLSLKEAKALVESPDKPVKEKIPFEEAEKIKARLEEVGATVEVK